MAMSATLGPFKKNLRTAHRVGGYEMALFADSFWSRYHRPFFFLQLKTIAGDNKKYQVEQEPCTGILKGCQFFGGYNRV